MNTTTKTSVLLRKMNLDDATRLVESKKSSRFGTPLGRPKKSQISIHSISLVYEPIMIVSGSYSADYYRKTTHPIKVDGNVKEVVVGSDTFEIRQKSKLSKLIHSSNKHIIDLVLEEHVFLENAGTLYIDHHGKRIKSIPYVVNKKNIESYGSKTLASEKTREHDVELDEALLMLRQILKNIPKSNARNLQEQFTPGNSLMLYVPVYEARLVGPSRKIRIMRIDAVRKKIFH